MLQQGYPVGRPGSPSRAHRHGLHPMGLPRGLHTVLTHGSAPQVGSPQHHQAWEQARCALCLSVQSGKQKKTNQVVVCSCHKDKTPLLWFPLQSQEVMSLCSCRYFAQQDLCPYRGLPGAIIIQNNGDKTSLTLQELLVCRQRQPRDAVSHPGSPGRDAIPYRCHKYILKEQFMNMACVW